MKNKYDTLAVNTLRVLSASMITKAKSGHPGICLGSAPIVHVLFTEFLNNYSGNSKWPGRDRFVLSAGHGSALLYALLHVSGFDLNMEDLMAFRQKGSRTPGHPEYGHTAGVEVTTGPLGQGLATAVGFAMAEKNLSGIDMIYARLYKKFETPSSLKNSRYGNSASPLEFLAKRAYDI